MQKLLINYAILLKTSASIVIRFFTIIKTNAHFTTYDRAPNKKVLHSDNKGAVRVFVQIPRCVFIHRYRRGRAKLETAGNSIWRDHFPPHGVSRHKQLSL